MRFFLPALFLLLSTTAFADFFSTSNVRGISANLGTHTEFYNNVQTDGNGTIRRFAFAPTAGVGLQMPITTDWNFLPELNWVLPRFIENSRILQNILMVRGDFGYDIVDWFRLRIGTSIMWLNQHGRGGSTQMNNGNSQTTFYYPDENRSSFNNTLDLGVEGLLSPAWSLRLQTYTYSIFRQERRQISYSLFLTYHWEN